MFLLDPLQHDKIDFFLNNQLRVDPLNRCLVQLVCDRNLMIVPVTGEGVVGAVISAYRRKRNKRKQKEKSSKSQKGKKSETNALEESEIGTEWVEILFLSFPLHVL